MSTYSLGLCSGNNAVVIAEELRILRVKSAGRQSVPLGPSWGQRSRLCAGYYDIWPCKWPNTLRL